MSKPKTWKLEDYFGDWAAVKDVEFFSTGFPELDEVAGFPKNMVSLVYGPFGVGKSTLMYKLIQNSPDKILYIDSEAALNTERLQQLNVDPKRFQVRRVNLIEDAYDLIMESLDEYDLIILDSVSSLSFKAEIEGEASDANMGKKAQIMNKLCRLLPVLIERSNCAVIFVNQERDRFDGMGKTVPGGMGQMYASSHTVRLSTDAKSKFQKNNEIAGHWTTAEVRKTRVKMPWRKTKFQVFYGGLE